MRGLRTIRSRLIAQERKRPMVHSGNLITGNPASVLYEGLGCHEPPDWKENRSKYFGSVLADFCARMEGGTMSEADRALLASVQAELPAFDAADFAHGLLTVLNEVCGS